MNSVSTKLVITLLIAFFFVFLAFLTFAVIFYRLYNGLHRARLAERLHQRGTNSRTLADPIPLHPIQRPVTARIRTHTPSAPELPERTGGVVDSSFTSIARRVRDQDQRSRESLRGCGPWSQGGNREPQPVRNRAAEHGETSRGQVHRNVEESWRSRAGDGRLTNGAEWDPIDALGDSRPPTPFAAIHSSPGTDDVQPSTPFTATSSY